jgi:hypothetical protein
MSITGQLLSDLHSYLSTRDEATSAGDNAVKFVITEQVSSPPLHLKTETDLVSETSCFYSTKHRTMEEDKTQ